MDDHQKMLFDMVEYQMKMKIFVEFDQYNFVYVLIFHKID